jgi:hypothetical protein
MCWLHSRLQRQFTYLANFRPSAPPPSHEQALEIIDRIVHRRGVTEIPGYRTLQEFSTHYKDELIAAIDGMGWRCFFGAPTLVNTEDCFARVGDDFHPTAETLQRTMDTLRERVIDQPGDIQFLRTRFQESGWTGAAAPLNRVFNPTAHSFLLLSMEPLNAPSQNPPLPGVKTGYHLRVIDPNFQTRVQEIDYHYGDTALPIGIWNVVPYDHYAYAGDIPEMNRQIAEYCRP